jgi:hypothetical protein
VIVRQKHCATSARVCHDARAVVIRKSIQIAPRKLPRSLQIARVSMKRAAAHLLAWNTNGAIIRFKHTSGRAIDAREKTFRDAACKEPC